MPKILMCNVKLKPKRCFAGLWIILAASLFAGPVHALGDKSANSAAKASTEITKTFGELSLSLSLTLSVPESKVSAIAGAEKSRDVSQLESAVQDKRLSELNAEIAAIEKQIGEQKRRLNIAPESSALEGENTSDALVSSGLLPELVTAPDQTATGVESDFVRENSKPKARESNANTIIWEDITAVDLPLFSGMKWIVALSAFLVVTFALRWNRRRKAVPVGEVVKSDGERVMLKNLESTQALKSVQPLDMTGLLPSVDNQILQTPAEPALKNEPGVLLPPEYEKLEEADIYLRFGHDKLAEEALRDAITINPENPQAYLTLLRIFFAREDSAAFLEYAQKLKSFADKSVWATVAKMGRNLDKDNSLYH